MFYLDFICWLFSWRARESCGLWILPGSSSWLPRETPEHRRNLGLGVVATVTGTHYGQGPLGETACKQKGPWQGVPCCLGFSCRVSMTLGTPISRPTSASGCGRRRADKRWHRGTQGPVLPCLPFPPQPSIWSPPVLLGWVTVMGGSRGPPSTPVPDRIPPCSSLVLPLGGCMPRRRGMRPLAQLRVYRKRPATWSWPRGALPPPPPSGFAFLSLLLITTIHVHCRKYEE